jgi:uncharacterized membrane protein
VNGTSGYQFWGMWVLLIVGTAAFWALISLAVRALYIGRDTRNPPTTDNPRIASQTQIRLQDLLARGAIAAEEYPDRRAQNDTVADRHPTP